MLPTWLSPVSLYGGFVRRCLSAAGLTPQSLDIDDDTTLHFWGPNPTSSSSSPSGKPALVLIHGFGPNGVWQWHPQISFFASDYNVFVPNLVFFGRSVTKSTERSEVFQAKCVGKLMEKLGVKRFSVVGTSYGGFVAYHMARMWPERVEKVVIASSAINLRKQDNDGLYKRANVDRIEDVLLPATAEQLRKLLSICTFRPPPGFLPDFLLNDLIRKLYAENRIEKVELLYGLTIGTDNTPEVYPLQQEVLLIWGEHDQLFLLEKATHLKEVLGKKSRLNIMKKTSHIPQLEDASQFNNIVNHFLCAAALQRTT
ncbi:unnamed protein product [Cuscuta europaea]|uniref:AB hydrolase-1 domain-containing protein n=1 Tax=Cuscuta europaea TaxID=41803 RepID=A0A9P0YRZ4_CUSEU|nr:unnamed protein product [Cuscuta europaea]